MSAPPDDGAAKIYTKGGDKGKTSLVGGARVSKGELRLDAYGTVDELSSVLGLLRADIAADLAERDQAESNAIAQLLSLVQSSLFEIGGHLACEDAKVRATLPFVGLDQIQMLERAMDAYSAKLKRLKHFILPGGARSAAVAHIARTVCRRTERLCVQLADTGGAGEMDPAVVQYLNRLSDYLFVLARHLNRLLAIDEPIWQGKKKG